MWLTNFKICFYLLLTRLNNICREMRRQETVRAPQRQQQLSKNRTIERSNDRQATTTTTLWDSLNEHSQTGRSRDCLLLISVSLSHCLSVTHVSGEEQREHKSNSPQNAHVFVVTFVETVANACTHTHTHAHVNCVYTHWTTRKSENRVQIANELIFVVSHASCRAFSHR